MHTNVTREETRIPGRALPDATEQTSRSRIEALPITWRTTIPSEVSALFPRVHLEGVHEWSNALILTGGELYFHLKVTLRSGHRSRLDIRENVPLPIFPESLAGVTFQPGTSFEGVVDQLSRISEEWFQYRFDQYQDWSLLGEVEERFADRAYKEFHSTGLFKWASQRRLDAALKRFDIKPKRELPTEQDFRSASFQPEVLLNGRQEMIRLESVLEEEYPGLVPENRRCVTLSRGPGDCLEFWVDDDETNRIYGSGSHGCIEINQTLAEIDFPFFRYSTEDSIQQIAREFLALPGDVIRVLVGKALGSK